MPRKARLEMPGDIHHVMSRGLNGEDIFSTDKDREWFINKLGIVLELTNCRCYAWVLMNNHYHLLLRPGVNSLCVTMRKLNSAYAQYYNRNHNRRGYLFQDRYKSIPTRDIGYLQELICYIHLNPIRAGVVNSLRGLNTYRWSGHYVLIGKQRIAWMHINEIFLRFGRSIIKGQRRYMECLAESVKSEKGRNDTFNPWHDHTYPELKEDIASDGSVAERDPVFVRRAVQEYNERLQRRVSLIKKGLGLDKIVAHVLSIFELKEEDIKSKCKRSDIVNARALICYWATEELGMSYISVARYFGQSCSTVIRAAQNGRMLVAENDYSLPQ